MYKTLKISKHDSGKLANAVEIATGEYESKDFIVFTENDPVSSDGKNRWQEGIDAWVNGQSDSRFKAPKDTYEGSDSVAVVIKEPGDYSQVNDNNVKVRVEASSVADVRTLTLSIDGEKKKETSDKTMEETYTLSNGNHMIIAKVTDSKGGTAERGVHVGVNQPYSTPTPTPN
jgi:hypothetical protein